MHLHSLKDFITKVKSNSYYNLASFFSHLGFGILIFFIILNHNFSEEFDLNIKVGETKKIGNMEIKFNNLKIDTSTDSLINENLDFKINQKKLKSEFKFKPKVIGLSHLKISKSLEGIIRETSET